MDENRLFALAELSYLHAERTRARPYYFAVVVYTYAFLFRGAEAPPPDPLDPRTRLAAELYNRALTEGLRNGAHIVVAAGEHPLPFGRLDVDLPGGEPMWGGRPLDEFLPASDIGVRGLRNRYRRAGLGAPLVARLGAVQGVPPQSSRVPPDLKVPITAFLRLEEVRKGLLTGQLRGALELYSMDAASRIAVEGRQVPLEFEPSAALASTLERDPVWDSESGLPPRQLPGRRRARSTPSRPTGPGVCPSSSSTARHRARRAGRISSTSSRPIPESRPASSSGSSPTTRGCPSCTRAGCCGSPSRRRWPSWIHTAPTRRMRRMVLIGHSQGGLLAKLTVVDSGTRFWDNVSETPFEELQVSDATRATLRRSMFMTPLPFVTRVVFVGTPHRGSDVAGFLTQRLRWLVVRALALPRAWSGSRERSSSGARTPAFGGNSGRASGEAWTT